MWIDEPWVRIMCDFCADPVWVRGGANGELAEFPVSQPLKAALRDWADRYERECPVTGEDWPGRQEFSDEGLLLARAVKAELPGWTVVYHDDAACMAGLYEDVPREVFEYEIA